MKKLRVGRKNWTKQPTTKQKQLLEKFGLTASCRLDASRLITNLKANNWQLPTKRYGLPKYDPKREVVTKEETKRRSEASLWAEFWATHDEFDDTTNE